MILGLSLMLVPLLWPAPQAMPETAWLASGLALTMALWWLTEALPLAVTALLPLAVAPLLEIAALDDLGQSYSHPLIILFFGGFLLAKAIEKSGLHRRIAHGLLGLAGDSPGRVLGAIMLTTAFLSLWISNTASAMVVAPIAAAIAGSQKDRPDLGCALMLGVAFSATIGGMGSLIGTPPNAIFAAHVREAYGVEVGFAQWAAIGIPVAATLLVIAWGFLAKVFPGIRGGKLSVSFSERLGTMSIAERRVGLIAGMTALAWIFRPSLDLLLPSISLTDAGIAIAAAVTLFLVPGKKGESLLDWKTASTLRWDVLILFGGGLALASILEGSGLAAWIGAFVQRLESLPSMALVIILAAAIIYIGELASNTAMAAIFLPIAGAAATSMGADPVLFMLPVAFSASIGFMLPVATPPNAIVFSNPAVSRKDMLRAGAPLDLIGMLVAVAGSMVLGPLLFG